MLRQRLLSERLFGLKPIWQRSVYSQILAFGSLTVLVLGASGRLDAQVSDQPIDVHKRLCPIVEAVARDNDLPLEFFIGVIWQESRFRPHEIGPITRNGQRAQGIAQFMPGTAVERGLSDPLNPIEALPKSGAFLAELRSEFGNLGLAAAAYNAGPQRVRDYLAGLRNLPPETRQYVLAITGRPAEMWKNSKEKWPRSQGYDVRSCEDLMALLEKSAARRADVPERNVPNWCRHLNHPNVHACGSVHAEETTGTAVPRLNPRRQPRISRAAVH